MLAMGMTIGSIFVMLYTLTDVFKANILIGNILKVLLFIYVISNIINFYVITRNHQEANKIDKNIVNEIADYIEKYEKETGITVKYATMVYFQNNNYGHYKKINSVNSLAIYSECSFDSIINFYTKKDLKRINFDDYITKRYIESIENELKPICIDDILVCPIYNY